MGNLFEGLHSGIDHFQRSAQQEISKLKPWAKNLEREMKPAMARVEEEFDSALDKFGFSFGQDRVDSHIMDTTGIPGLGSLLGANLDPFSLFGLARKNWWEGPNVCIERKVFEEDDENQEGEEADNRRSSKFFAMDMSFTSCRDDFNFHECTSQINRNGVKKTVTVRHQCCYGHERSDDGTTGCTHMVMEDLPSTLKGMGVSEFTALLEENGMTEEYLKSNNVTLFAPSDDAIEDFRHDLQQLNSLDNDRNSYNIDDGLSYKRKKRELTIIETPALDEILKAHMVEGFLDTADVHDEDVFKSINGHDIRMTVYNTYPQRAVMANCAKVTSRDHYSTNGVVHIVDKVMMPATKTLKEMVETDIQLSSLRAVLEKSDLLDTLAQPGQLTLLAPNNDAFGKLDQETIAKLEKGNGCSKDILLHHLLPNVICTGVIQGKAKTINANDKYVILERNVEDELVVDNVKITTRDIMGTNGVIHIIEEVLIPETARTVIEAMEEGHMTTLKELFQQAGMEEVLDNMSNVTIFAPSEKALSTLPREMVEDMKNNPEKLREFLMYHITSPKTSQSGMSNNKVLKTKTDQNLRINTYGGVIPIMDKTPNVITAQCARITNLDSEVCGGMIHTVDKVLMPPIGNFMDVMKLDPKHTEWVSLVQAAEMEEELNEHAGPLTMLAPTDGAFANMNEEEKSRIFQDKEIARQVVRHHMLREMLCCAGINRNFMFFDQSTKFTLLEDDIVSVRRSNGGYLYADRAELTTCDMMANNGVIHSIDRVLLPLGLRPNMNEQEEQPQERILNHQPHGYRLNPLDLFKNINIRFQ